MKDLELQKQNNQIVQNSRLNEVTQVFPQTKSDN